MRFSLPGRAAPLFTKLWQEVRDPAQNRSHVIQGRGQSAVRRPYFHNTPLIPAAIGALAGSTLADPRAGLLALAAALVLYASCRSSRWTAGTQSRPEWFVVVAVACLSFALGTWRGAVWSAKWAAVDRAGAYGPVEVILLPVGPVRFQEFGGRATFRARLAEPKPLHGLFGEVTVHAADAALVREGVPLTGFGRLSLPEQAMNPGDFDFRRYLASERAFAAYECSRIDECDPRRVPLSWRWISGAFGRVRSHLASSIDRSMPAGEGAVLKGILLADRSGVLDELSTDFRRSGFYRFITIAGFHVDAVFAMVESSTRRLFRKPTAARLSAACLAGLYAALSGWTPGALRALTCACMRSFAPELHRRYFALAGLSMAAIVSAWVVPFPLTDVGFLLSAVGALGGFAAGRYFPRAASPGRRVLTGAARSGVLVGCLFPVTAAFFSEFTVLGFLLGGLWTAAVSALIPLSLLVALVPLFGTACGWLPYLILKGVILVSSVVSSSGSSVCVPAPGITEILAYYGLLLIFAASAEGRLRSMATGVTRLSSSSVVCVLGCSAVLFASAWLRSYAPWPTVTFLSVGQADCAVVRQGTTAVLVDTGTPGASSRSVSRYLRRLGITDVDLCVLSHLHQDHAGGLPALCLEVPVGGVLVPPGSGGEAAALLAVPPPVRSNRPVVPAIVEAVSGTVYRLGRLSMSVTCAPEGRPPEGDENRSSLVVVLTIGEGTGPHVEFWGDAPREEISDYLSTYPSVFAREETGMVAKVPHHGSRDSLDDRFYDRLCGGFAVISVGTNSYGHPSDEVLEAAYGSGVRLLRTDLHGAITVTFTPLGVSVRSYR